MTTTVLHLPSEFSDLINLIKIKYLNRGLTYGWLSSETKAYDFGHWNRQILSHSNYFPHDHSELSYIDYHPEIKLLWNFIKESTGANKLLRVYINGYTYGTDAYTHVDEIYMLNRYNSAVPGRTIIVYLNETWDIDWAGETVIFNDEREIEASVLPKYMRVLSFDADKLHAARPVSRACNVLRSVLVFKTIDTVVDPAPIDFLLSKTKSLPHSGKTFFEHLYNTMIILEKGKERKELCAAGLFHSIYGTEFYKFHDASITRDQIRSLIGEYAESLVYEFCSLTDRYQTLVNNSKGYSDDFRKDLIKIELANLTEQNLSGQYSNQISILKGLLQ